MEQSERDVFELLDLGFGRCRMVLATVEGDPDPAAEALRRLGVVRVATKYPRIAAALLRAHRPPGRDRRGQGLGRAGAADRPGRGDRRPHGDGHDAARERPRRARGDRRGHGAADRQPGRAQAQGRGDRPRRGAPAWRLSALRLARGRRRGALAAQVRALVRRAGLGRRRGRRDRRAPSATRGDAALLRARGALRRGWATRRCASTGGELDERARRASTRPCAAAWRSRSPTSRAVAEAGPGRRRRRRPAPGPARARARAAGRAAPRSTSRAGATRTRAPSSWASSPRAPPACEEVVVCAPGAHPVILAACALCGVDEVCAWAARTRSPRWPTAPRRSRASTSSPARAASTCRRPSGRSSRRRRDRRLRRAQRRARARRGRRATPSSSRPTCSPRPSTARAPSSCAVSDDAALLDDVAARADRAGTGEATCALVHAPGAGGCAGLRRGVRPRAPRAGGRRRRGARAAGAPRRLRLRGRGRAATAFGDYVAGSNHALPTGGAARFASGLSARTSAGA